MSEPSPLPAYVQSLLSKVQMSKYFKDDKDLAVLMLQYTKYIEQDEKLRGIFIILGYSTAQKAFTRHV